MVGKRRRVQSETKGTVRPLGDRILVKLEEVPIDSYSDGGIFLPPSVVTDRVCAKGTIKAVGPGTRNSEGEFVPMDCKVGQFILFGKYAGVELKLRDKEHRIMHAADILGILAEPEDNPDHDPFEVDESEDSEAEDSDSD